MVMMKVIMVPKTVVTMSFSEKIKIHKITPHLPRKKRPKDLIRLLMTIKRMMRSSARRGEKERKGKTQQALNQTTIDRTMAHLTTSLLLPRTRIKIPQQLARKMMMITMDLRGAARRTADGIIIMVAHRRTDVVVEAVAVDIAGMVIMVTSSKDSNIMKDSIQIR